MQRSSKRRYVVALLAILAMVTLCLSSPASASTQVGQTGFSDTAGHWAAADITEWQAMCLISGDGSGGFRPDDGITRAEFAALVNRIFGFTSQASASSFPDVQESDWFAPDIARAITAGYLSGYDDGQMRPNQFISRQEVAVILMRLLQLRTPTTLEAIQRFSDIARLAGWSSDAVASAVRDGYLRGYPDGSFGPTQTISRAETIVMLRRVAGTIYDTPGEYGPTTGGQTISGDITVRVPGVTFRNTNVRGRMVVTGSAAGGPVILSGHIQSLTVVGQAQIELAPGCVIDDLTVAPSASGVTLTAATGAQVGSLTLRGQTAIAGSGTIGQAMVGVAGCSFASAPGQLTVGSSLSVLINGVAVTNGQQLPTIPPAQPSCGSAYPTLSGTTLTWSSVSHAVRYHVQIRRDEAVVADTDVASSPYDASAVMAQAGAYTATVTAIGDGVYLNGPAVNAGTVTRLGQAGTPAIDVNGLATWPAVPGCTQYGIAVTRVGDVVTTPLVSATNSIDLSTPLRGLGAGSYTITVRAIGNAATTIDGAPSGSSSAADVIPLPPPPPVMFTATTMTWGPVAGASSYDVSLCRDGSLVNTWTVANATPLSAAAFMNVPGTYTAYVQATGSGLVLDSIPSALSLSMIRLGQVAQPTLDADGIAHWATVPGGMQYTIKLTEDGVGEIGTFTATTDAASGTYDLLSAIQAQGTGQYTITVQATGAAAPDSLPGAASLASPIRVSGVLPQGPVPTWGGTTLSWTAVEGGPAQYRLVLYRDGVQAVTRDVIGTQTNCDFSADAIAAGLYTATVQPLGSGALTQNGAVSAPSEPLARFRAGDGSAANPFTIDNARDLDRIRYALRSCYVLTADIDMSIEYAAGFAPIGGLGMYDFFGRLDGAGHTIASLTLNTPVTDSWGTTYIGLFVQTNNFGAQITNLHLTNVSVTGDAGFAGAIAADNGGLIQGCTVTGSVSADGAAGMIAGRNFGTIADCEVSGTVNGAGYIGGIAGISDAEGSLITGCRSHAAVTGAGAVAGGIAGLTKGTVTNCAADGTVTAGSAAGIIGYLYGGHITDCFSLSAVIDGSSSVGRIWNSINGGTAERNYANQATTDGTSAARFSQKGANARDGADITVDSCWKVFDTFSVAGELRPATIDWLNRTVTVEVRSGSSRAALVATFTVPAGSTVAVSAVPQVSGTTANDFTSPVTYTITDRDTNSAAWTVTAVEVGAVTLDQVAQPTWSGTNATWGDVLNETGYDVKLYWEDDAAPLATQSLGANVTSFDFASAIAAKGSGAYRVTVQAKGNGDLYLDGPASVLSNRLVRFSGGSGSEADPYHVASAVDLNNIRYALTACYEQVTDIDLASYASGAGWNPIGRFGDVSGYFYGSYDGCGFQIRNLTMNRPGESYLGLFGVAAAQTEHTRVIRDVSLTNVSITGQEEIGALVGYCVSDVINCTVSGSINAVDGAGGAREIGMLVGFLSHGSVERCAAQGTITGTADFAGGLVGYSSNSSIVQSRTDVAVTGAGDLGGITGVAMSTTIESCSAKGTITGSSNIYGGIVGSLDKEPMGTDSIVRHCFALNSSITHNSAGTPAAGRIYGSAANTTLSDNYGYADMVLPTRYNAADESGGGCDGIDCDLTAFDKAFTSFTVPGATGAATIDAVAHTISITVDYGTARESLAATFDLSLGAHATVSDAAQVSGTTPNDFTSPVVYTVTGWDGSTTTWIVTVNVAPHD